MKEVPMIDAFDTTDFNPELILSSVFLDPGLDFVASIDDLGDNIIASDLLQQLGSSVFYTDTTIASGAIASVDTTAQQHTTNQPQQHHHYHQQQQQQQHVLAQQTPTSISSRTRVTSEGFNRKVPILM
uniref:Uncharacterized protein n=1 Tax=Anopheles farauti TaxID=69004 RepID=A0A182QJ43_9DIPT